MAIGFLQLPPELRLQIYEYFIDDHQRVRRKSQPSNTHLRLLYTCALVAAEAGPLLRRYISLLHEHHINAFLIYTPLAYAAQIEWADVANDGRVFHAGPARNSNASTSDQPNSPQPLSNLHLALARMTALRRLRVFQPRQGLPINLQNTMNLQRSGRLAVRFERAMFPNDGPALSYYELYLNQDTRVDLFEAIQPSRAVVLRLSGELVVVNDPKRKRHRSDRGGAGGGSGTSIEEATHTPMPTLRRVTLVGVKGAFFDRHTLEDAFPGAALEAFAYALCTRLGFELRDRHLASLAAAHGATLRSLVLLGCARLSSAALAAALAAMPALERFALHLVTVNELKTDFVRALPASLDVLMLQVIDAWYAVALVDEEHGLCESIEHTVLLRDRAPHQVLVCFRDKVMDEDGRRIRWKRIAADRKIDLRIGPWESNMVDNL